MKKAPAIQKSPDWEELSLPFSIGSGRTLASGPEEQSRLRVKFFRRKSDRRVVGRVWFGDGAEGPPLHAHGGAIAYILDEAMGTAGWAEGFAVVAADLQFEYFHMTPLYADHTLEAWVESRGDRRLVIKAQLTLADGRASVAATGHFHVLKDEKMKALLKQVPKDRLAAERDLLAKALNWSPDDKD